MQSLCQGKGQRSHKAKNRRKHFRGKIGQAISNLVAVLVSDLWAMAGKNGTVFFNNWPPSWMCHSDRTGCWTWVSPHRKESMSLISAQFYNMPGRYERVCVGWHCAKVKGHAELKIERSREKTFIYDFPKLYHSSPNSFGGNAHRHTKVKSEQGTNIEGAPKVPLCTKYGAIPTIISGVTAFWKKWHTPFFLDLPPSWKCLFDQTGFRTCPSPEWKKADMWILERFMLFFFSYRAHSTSWHIRAGEEVKGQMEL